MVEASVLHSETAEHGVTGDRAAITVPAGGVDAARSSP